MDMTIHESMYAFTRVCVTWVHQCFSQSIYIYIICMHVRMYVCMFVYVYIYVQEPMKAL